MSHLCPSQGSWALWVLLFNESKLLWPGYSIAKKKKKNHWGKKKKTWKQKNHWGKKKTLKTKKWKLEKNPSLCCILQLMRAIQKQYPTERIYLCETIQMHTLHIDCPLSGEWSLLRFHYTSQDSFIVANKETSKMELFAKGNGYFVSNALKKTFIGNWSL